MKKQHILIIAAIAIVIIAVILVSLLNKNEYTDQYSSNELFNKVSNSFATDGGIKELDQDVILEFTDEDPPYLIDYTVIKANNAKNINEIGIFKVKSGNAKEMLEIVKAYVENLQQSYRAMDYFPEEVEKIDFATYKVYGNYVVYSFLNEKDTDSFYSAIENNISK